MAAALRELPAWMAGQPASQLGEVIKQSRQLIDGTEAACAEATRRFEKSGGYRSDGSPGIVPWLRANANLSGGAAAERVEVARQLEELPRTGEALARGEIGYQHAVAMARSAEHIGSVAVRKAEATLLQAAQTMDPGQFTGVVKDYEHRVDAEAALNEANRAHQRRYLSISEPVNGLARIEGQLMPEAAATLRSAIEPFMKPSKSDRRTSGQRAHDALVELCQHSGARASGSAPRPLLIIKTTVDTLAGIPGAPAGELDWGGTIPSETVRRWACDAAITRITGLAELENEITHAARTTPPATRRALVARDGHCVFPGCDRPQAWYASHHLKFWADGGPTKLENLGLLCVAHHRRVHEEGWQLKREDKRWVATAPTRAVTPHARS
jgi:hypothetical protein